MDRPKFLDYTQTDHEQARAIPYVRDLVEWVAYEQINSMQDVLVHLRADRVNDAKQSLAKADAASEMIRVFWAPAPVTDAPEEKFRDPALPEGVE